MRKIEVPGEINEINQLILDESLEEIKPQRVEIDIWFRDEDEEEYRERTKEEILDGIREGFRESVLGYLAGDAYPIQEMWDSMMISTTGAINDNGNLVLDEPLRQAKSQYVDVVIWFIKNDQSLANSTENLAQENQTIDSVELVASVK